MYDYSIIIPHKNIPELLERCLASIPRRDDVQVIVVDDNSDEAVVDFARFPGLGVAGTEVVFTHEEQGRKGAGYARNVGMEKALGKWLVFADADDFFLPPLAGMMDKYRDCEADIVFFGNTWVDAGTLMPIGDSHQMRHIERFLTTGNDDALRYRMFAPWGKFVKKRLVDRNNLRFSETACSNDLFFSITSGHTADAIECDPEPVYAYVRRAESLTGMDDRNFDSLPVRFDEDVKVVRFMRSVGRSDRYFDRLVLRRWKQVMRVDRKNALLMLPAMKELYPASKIAGLRLKFVFDPVIQKIKNPKNLESV